MQCGSTRRIICPAKPLCGLGTVIDCCTVSQSIPVPNSDIAEQIIYYLTLGSSTVPAA